MADETYRKLKSESKRQRIFFGSQKYSLHSSENVPEEHKEKFDAIQVLGRTLYDAYAFTPSNDSLDKPWQNENKQRASRLVRGAVTCRKENRNEAGWRYELEPQIFERFKVEVTCKICRKRLWRSETEVDQKFGNSKTSSLKDRQARRMPCKCSPASRLNDCLDPGISDIFSSRVEERCVDNNSKTFEKRPDRTYGLQETKNVEKLLQREYAHARPGKNRQRLVSHVVRTSTNPDNGGAPLHFPFLIHEAKGEKGVNNFEEMEIQTALPIKRALHIQQNLKETHGNTMEIPGGPLVWFTANRGETWRLYAGTVYEEDGRPNYLVSHLWEGSITGHDEALQLILIVDFIVDWARDIYRPSILRQLKALGTADTSRTMSFELDTDIYSLRGDLNPWIEEHDSTTSGIEEPEIVEITRHHFGECSDHHWKQIRTPSGIIHHGRDIESRFRALHITRDNLGTLLQSFEKPADEIRFMRDLMAVIGQDCFHLTNEADLDAIEDTWTGNLRTTLKRASECQKKVHALLRLCYFVDLSWGLVRELTILAVNEDAIEMLLELSQSSVEFPTSQNASLLCWPKDLILERLHTVLRSNFRDDFKDCLQRRSFTLTDWLAPQALGPHHPRSHSVLSPDWNINSTASKAHAMVHAIYDMHRIGRRAPSEPFLRISSRSHLHSRTGGISTNHDFARSKMGWEMGLVYSAIPEIAYLDEECKRTLCLYTLPTGHGTSNSQEPTANEIVDGLIQVLFERRAMKTFRGGKSPPTHSVWQDNDLKYSFWLDTGHTRLDIKHEELIISIIKWIRDMRPNIHLLPKAEAYMTEYDIRPDALTPIEVWMNSLNENPGPITAAADKGMQNAVLRSIAKKSASTVIANRSALGRSASGVAAVGIAARPKITPSVLNSNRRAE